MKWMYSLVSLFFLIGISFGADGKIVGADKPIKKNGFASLSLTPATKDEVVVYWSIYPRPVQKEIDGNHCRFSGPPGTEYEIEAIVLNLETKIPRTETAIMKVEGGKEDEDVIPPPENLSQFDKDLITAYKGLSEMDKRYIPWLADVYEFGASQIALRPVLWSALFGDMQKKAIEIGVGGKLVPINLVIKNYLLTTLPWKGEDSLRMTDADYDKAKTEFQKVATVLRKLK